MALQPQAPRHLFHQPQAHHRRRRRLSQAASALTGILPTQAHETAFAGSSSWQGAMGAPEAVGWGRRGGSSQARRTQTQPAAQQSVGDNLLFNGTKAFGPG